VLIQTVSAVSAPVASESPVVLTLSQFASGVAVQDNALLPMFLSV
jgi:hypothetical protein